MYQAEILRSFFNGVLQVDDCFNLLPGTRILVNKPKINVLKIKRSFFGYRVMCGRKLFTWSFYVCFFWFRNPDQFCVSSSHSDSGITDKNQQTLCFQTIFNLSELSEDLSPSQTKTNPKQGLQRVKDFTCTYHFLKS